MPELNSAFTYGGRAFEIRKRLNPLANRRNARRNVPLGPTRPGRLDQPCNPAAPEQLLARSSAALLR